MLDRFPTKILGGTIRSFQPKWYERFDWLEYSQLSDAAFCYVCRHFPSPGTLADNKFTTKVFSNWKKATYSDGGFSSHQRSQTHIQSLKLWQDWKKAPLRQTVLNMLTDERHKQILPNRHYISAVIESLRFTAVHRIAQRGHNKSTECSNRGNFLDLMHLIGKFDVQIGDKLVNLPKNAKYTSKVIQNEILQCMADMVRNKIALEVRDSVQFAVMVDESKDCRKIEQVSLVLRYFNKNAVCEAFLGFFPAHDLTAEGLSQLILDNLRKCGLDYCNNLIGQGYDGASVMSGRHKGVAALIKETAISAIYIHCHAHRLNLVLVDSIKASRPLMNFSPY